MGGSSPYSPIHSGGVAQSNYCGGEYEFGVVINDSVEQVESIWNEVREGDCIQVILIEETLPRLEIRRVSDNFFIGYLPIRLVNLINCIKEGWRYDGYIVNISGNRYSPEIDVKIEGVI
ncbi:hypothetical protein SAMN05444401_3322 [Clostridium amylolyticum]|uniref:HIRAN domain-containing protein n=1 Tax=Clostridium amylolyticum TaxID=1121298 RepID=A0A1M6KDL5_9CLOT|nr:hypothetical protein [Clostridium amylolyticum]SHJ57050.1 hypothetical protein SAMN05444401_3322 [Clostridium amylolyticum]